MADKLVAVYVWPVAPGMFVKVLLSDDDCHCTVPLLPLNVKLVLFVPVQTVAAPLIEPGTERGLTVTAIEVVVDEEHGLLVTTAR